MAKQIFYSVRRRDFLYLQGIEPNENYKAGAKSPTMGTPHISADYRSMWGKEERMFEPLTLASYIKIILEEYRWEDRLPDDLAILCHVDKRFFWDEPPKEERLADVGKTMEPPKDDAPAWPYDLLYEEGGANTT